jgi:hypothetical protein
MASDKYFLFRTGDITKFSEVFTDTGENLSVLSISTDRVAYITAKQGSVVVVFNNAGLYDTFQGTNREALIKTRMEVECNVGEEYQLVKKITQFITSPTMNKRVLEFDAVASSSTFNESAPETLRPLLPKFPVVMSTQAISDDPAATDLTQTTTTTIADITFPAPSLMPIVDYNETTLPAHGSAVGAANNWNNSGSGGSTYHITNDTGTPAVNEKSGTSVNAVDIAPGDNLIMANALEIDGAYTIYMVIGTVGYGSFGHSILDNGATHIGFAAAAGDENTNSEFWVRHDTAGGRRPAYMQLNNTNGGTAAYKFPDPALENSDVNTVGFEGQQTYVFVLRRDKDLNLYLHNHTGNIVGYVEALTGQGDFATDGTLKVDDIGTGFRGFLPRIGIISTDIGISNASKLAQDLFDKYKKVF